VSIAPFLARYNQRARVSFPLGEQVEALERLTENLLVEYREKEPSETRHRIDSRGRGIAFRLIHDTGSQRAARGSSLQLVSEEHHGEPGRTGRGLRPMVPW
jgi:hypothetical protein